MALVFLSAFNGRGPLGWGTLEIPITHLDSGPRLWSYSKRPWFGDIFRTNTAGRAWATTHSPQSGWYYKKDWLSTAARWWRTGSTTPFVDFKEITGPAYQQFDPVRVNFIGLQRLLKRQSGQYFTLSPGDLSLQNGAILPPSGWQRFRFYGDTIASNILINPVAWGAGGTVYYVIVIKGK